ncbi:MAG: hypothetical protein DMD87_01155 [Candidatus Rokuibacteriota bacterium]|nr:MAG: hypothetical protein DMD87_01155 [Candidatus Rokubacteria bacterium]
MVMSVSWPSKKTFAHLHADCFQFWKALEEEAMTELRPERCCCGGLYAEHGGAGRQLLLPNGPTSVVRRVHQ